MHSQNQDIREVLSTLNTMTDEIRSFRQHTEDAWKAGQALLKEREDEYEIRLRQCDGQSDKQQRSYDFRWKLSWILNGWFLFVSVMFILWLAQQP